MAQVAIMAGDVDAADLLGLPSDSDCDADGLALLPSESGSASLPSDSGSDAGTSRLFFLNTN